LQLDIDLDYLSECLHRWREATILTLPMKDEFKRHMIEQRPAILKNHERTAAAWLMALRSAVPAADDTEVFKGFMAALEDFQNWAAAELKELDTMTLPAATAQGVGEIIANAPELAARLNELGKKIRNGSGDAG
jgi:antirestriction protein